jgi:hypothetical protein
MVRRFLIVSMLTSFLLVSARPSWPQEVPSREKMRDVIGAMREVLKHGLHTHYEVNQSLDRKDCGSALVQIGGGADGSQLHPYWHGEHAMKDGKFYHRTGGSREAFTAEEMATMFDGATYYSHMPKSRVVILYREAPHPPGAMTPNELLYMELIGFESPTAREPVPSLRGVGNPHPYDLLEILSDDSYSMRYADQTLQSRIVVLEKPGVERIWLDENRGFAVTKRQRNWNNSDVPMMIIENSEFVELAGGAWLPRASEIKYYGRPDTACSGMVAVTAKLTMRELSHSPPDSLFVPNVEGAIQAVDLTLVPGKSNQYRTKHVNLNDFNGENLAEFVKITPASLGPSPNNNTVGLLGGSRMRRWVLLANLVLVLVILAAIFRRRRKAT